MNTLRTALIVSFLLGITSNHAFATEWWSGFAMGHRSTPLLMTKETNSTSPALVKTENTSGPQPPSQVPDIAHNKVTDSMSSSMAIPTPTPSIPTAVCVARTSPTSGTACVTPALCKSVQAAKPSNCQPPTLGFFLSLATPKTPASQPGSEQLISSNKAQ